MIVNLLVDKQILLHTSSSSQSLITAYGHPKTVRLPDSHSKEMKDLVAR